LFGFYFPAVVVVDAESGWLVRATVFKGGKPVTRLELRDVSPLATDSADPAGDFAFEVPEGLPVEELPEPDMSADEAPDYDDESWEPRGYGFNPIEAAAKAAAEAIKKRADEKVAAARGFFDSLRSPKPPRD